MERRFRSIDCMKGISCLAVVLIHYNFPGDLGIAIKTLSRFAVPVFFAISGFFLVSPNDNLCYKDWAIKKGYA